MHTDEREEHGESDDGDHELRADPLELRGESHFALDRAFNRDHPSRPHFHQLDPTPRRRVAWTSGWAGRPPERASALGTPWAPASVGTPVGAREPLRASRRSDHPSAEEAPGQEIGVCQ